MSNKPRILLYRFLYSLATIYWKIFRPKSRGVVCLIEFENKILLARNTYGDRKWIFPGGGCKRGEAAEKAARREVAEEVGINLEQVSKIGDYTDTEMNKNAVVYCFYAKTESPELNIDKNEIAEAAWFEWTKLPQPLSIDTKRIIKLYKAYADDSLR